MPDSAVLGHDAPAEQAAPDAAVFVALYTGHVLRAGLRLGLPDALGDEPASAAELADRMGLDPRALRRLLRALVALGFLDRTADGRYAHTPRSQLVRADDEFGRSLAAFATNPAVEQAWHGLAESVRTGRGPFAAHHGTDFYTYLSGDDGLSTAFRTAMRAGEEWIASSEIEALAQYASGTVVDVGGNRGALLRELLMRAPRARGILFDLASVVDDPDPELRSGALADRCELVAGDARESAPAGADLYVLRAVLHNWDDETAVRILTNCARAGRPGARVAVIEMVLPEEATPSPMAAVSDLDMFVLFGSGERTESEFVELFRRAGLDYAGSRPASGLTHLMECRIPS